MMAKRRDFRLKAVVITVLAVSTLGYVIASLPPQQPLSLQQEASKPDEQLALEHIKQAREKEIDERFRQAVAMLHAKQYDYAVKALHRVLDLSPRMPEAHVNMGFALYGLNDYKAAHDFFLSAIELRPEQANAYYGLAIALEQMHDLQGALGAMRTYLHRNDEENTYRRRAMAAIWEWEAALKRQRAEVSQQTIPET